MNNASRSAIRLGLDQGHQMFGIHNGFEGLADEEIQEMNWMSVNGWAAMGGSELGTSRKVPKGSDLYAIARTIEKYNLHGLLVVGGWNAYEAVHILQNESVNFPAFNIPMICLPATINNNLPGTEVCIGADTALNSIVEAVDKVKQSAVAARRCFVVEVMGHYCGYLALMSGLATGAEKIYLHEEGVTLKELQYDVENLVQGFQGGKRLGLMIRSEYANHVYTTPFMCAVFEEEGHDLFDVRQTILGHMQQGGDPSPFDRIMATRLAKQCIDFLIDKAQNGSNFKAFIGMEKGEIKFHDIEEFPRMADMTYQRPKEQWWLSMLPIAALLSTPQPEN